MKSKLFKNLGIATCAFLLAIGSNYIIKANQLIVPNISYTLSNYQVNDVTNFDYNINLSSSEPYGKVFYDNESSEKAYLWVKRGSKKIDEITIDGGTSDNIKWEKTGFGDKKYTIGLRSDGGATNLSGKLSLGKSDEEFAN